MARTPWNCSSKAIPRLWMACWSWVEKRQAASRLGRAWGIISSYDWSIARRDQGHRSKRHIRVFLNKDTPQVRWNGDLKMKMNGSRSSTPAITIREEMCGGLTHNFEPWERPHSPSEN